MAIPEKLLISLINNYARPKKDYTYLTVVGVGHLKITATSESYTLTPALVKLNLRNKLFCLRDEYFFNLQ